MIQVKAEHYAADLTADNDRRNLAIIDEALKAGRLNAEAADYIKRLYSNGIKQFREVFYFLGKCFGAPKAPVMRYDYENDTAIDESIAISDINPLVPYIVQHRLDADPMRNQFFTVGEGHKVDLAVSSIVSVIVGAQKNVKRAIEKVSGKYYDDYVAAVTNATYQTILATRGENSARAVADKINKKMREQFITDPSRVVLSIIGSGHENIAVELVRTLDKIVKPHLLLQDVWRVKCLFDLIPQARTFIERVHEMIPERILSVRDNFYDVVNPRNYRDSKIIIDIGKNGQVIPMEIICQVRTFFEYEHRTHKKYEQVRKATKNKNEDSLNNYMAHLHDSGAKEYNLLIVKCLDSLFDRVGWNILYSQDNRVSMFEGFPHKCGLYYPQKVLDRIADKLSDAVNNEVFRITDAPAHLTRNQEVEIFNFMAEFILVSAMPYSEHDWTVPRDTLAGRLFNFVMSELQRYYSKHR